MLNVTNSLFLLRINDVDIKSIEPQVNYSLFHLLKQKDSVTI